MKLKYTIIIILSICNISVFSQTIEDVLAENREKLFKENTIKAKNGDAQAQYDLGQMYYYGVGTNIDFKEAFDNYLKSANQENVDGIYALANMYYLGEGVEQDKKKALVLYTQASDKGEVNATFNLANMYFYGESTEVNAEKALALYTICAEKDDVHAQIIVGMMYYNGFGTKKDVDKAKLWLNKARENGNRKASQLLEEINKTEN